MSDDQYKLQKILDIASHYGKMFEVSYGCDKTKIIVNGSKLDQQFFSDMKPWMMNNQIIDVVLNNEHLGQIISNYDEFQKNVDQNIAKARKSLFSLLGPTLGQNCEISPVSKLHILKTYVLPILKNGLSTFPLRPNIIKSLDIFHRKVLKSCLKLSVTAKSCSLYFLTGQTPMTVQLHYDIFNLFHIIWSNPQTKIYSLIKYILENSCDNSNTWSAHLRNLSRMYNMKDPKELISYPAPPKEVFKKHVSVVLTSYHEKEQREQCIQSESMKYFNVNLFGLSGKPHPAISDIYKSQEVQNMRHHIKLLVGNYLTNEKRARDSGGNPNCVICQSNSLETYCHFLVECSALEEPRNNMLPVLINFCHSIGFSFIEEILKNNEILCQFILDPSSMNLQNRININDPNLTEVFRICRNYCYSLHTLRMKKMKEATTHN